MTTAIQATNQDGREEEFQILASGQVQHKWQTVAGTWVGSSSMTNLVTTAGSVALDGSQPLTYNERGDGCIELEATAVGGAIARAWQLGPNGAGGWHFWTTAF